MGAEGNHSSFESELVSEDECDGEYVVTEVVRALNKYNLIIIIVTFMKIHPTEF